MGLLWVFAIFSYCFGGFSYFHDTIWLQNKYLSITYRNPENIVYFQGKDHPLRDPLAILWSNGPGFQFRPENQETKAVF